MNKDDTLRRQAGSFSNDHWQTLNSNPATVEHLQSQVAALICVVRSLAQETATLKRLVVNGIHVSEDAYRNERVETMISDHSSLGPDPETAYSLYQHTLDEDAFLKDTLRMSDEDRRGVSRKIREAGAMS